MVDTTYHVGSLSTKRVTEAHKNTAFRDRDSSELHSCQNEWQEMFYCFLREWDGNTASDNQSFARMDPCLSAGKSGYRQCCKDIVVCSPD